MPEIETQPIETLTPEDQTIFLEAITDAGGLTRSKSKAALWALSFRGLQDIPIMTNPPAVSVSTGNSSSLIASTNGSNVPVQGQHQNLTLAGAQEYVVQGSGITTVRGNAPDILTGAKRYANLLRAKSMLTAPVFELCYIERQFSRINMLVDGKLVTIGEQDIIPNGMQSGSYRYMKFDFGADVLTHGLVSVTSFAGGTGYAVGDEITVTAGIYGRPMKAKVGAVSSGVVTALYIQDAGSYSERPSFPISTSSTGSGTGLTIGAGFWQPIHTTLRPREIEFLTSNIDIRGVVYEAPTTAAVGTPARYNSLKPKVYWLDDSQGSNTYPLFAGGELGFLTTLRLGMHDNLIIDAQGGTGFAKPNVDTNNPAFEHPNRVNALIAAQPDIVVFPFSQNVDTQATSTAAAVSFIQTLQAALPNALFVMVGPAFGGGSWHVEAMAAVMAAAPDPSRIRMVDTVTQGWATDTNAAGGSTGYLTSDNIHWGTWGNVNWRSKLLAEGIAYAVQDMVLN